MRIEIDKNGHLWLERGGVLKIQYCPRQELRCGDWCPLFGEPATFFNGSYDYTEFTICHRKWKCDTKDFTDRRGKA